MRSERQVCLAKAKVIVGSNCTTDCTVTEWRLAMALLFEKDFSAERDREVKRLLAVIAKGCGL